MNGKKFEKLVNEAIKTIPKKILGKLDNVDIVIEEETNPISVKKTQGKKKFNYFWFV